MYVSDILKDSEGTRFSLEVYPPKAAGSPDDLPIQKHLSAIFDTVEHLIRYDPAFISVTYNPTGSTRTTSIPIAAIIKQRYGVESVAHLTCIATPRAEIARTLDVLEYFGIENILALRGDRPEGSECPPDSLEYASDLVSEIRAHDHDFCIGVAGYPEGHPECLTSENKKDMTADLQFFQNKITGGASFAISQLFLENPVYFDFITRAQSAGIEIPILPGIMPITDMDTIGIVTGLIGATIPVHLMQKFEGAKDDPAEIIEIGIDHAIHQCKGLMDKVPCIHFYTMDKWEPVHRIIESLIH
jgi:methylenetetrahydrofolate reductase (NADPH)